MNEKLCSAMVFDYGGHGALCQRKATTSEHGKLWCSIHAPSYRMAKVKKSATITRRLSGEEGKIKGAERGIMTRFLSTPQTEAELDQELLRRYHGALHAIGHILLGREPLPGAALAIAEILEGVREAAIEVECARCRGRVYR